MFVYDTYRIYSKWKVLRHSKVRLLFRTVFLNLPLNFSGIGESPSKLINIFILHYKIYIEAGIFSSCESKNNNEKLKTFIKKIQKLNLLNSRTT